MSETMELSCTCGAVRGTVSQLKRGTRLICMCDDCQCYAHWLQRADDILDAHGGTDVYQLSPAQVKFTTGREHIRCMRLSPKGLMRWYAECCKTPLANSLRSARIPFVGLPHLVMDHRGDGRSRDEALGPVRAACNARFAVGGKPEGSYDRAPLGILVRAVTNLAGAFVRGAARPSPLFDDKTGDPIVEPTILTLAQREALRGKLHAATTTTPD